MIINLKIFIAKNLDIFLNKELENKYKFERVIFQRQENNRLGIVVHIKNKDFIEKVLSEGEKNFKK